MTTESRSQNSIFPGAGDPALRLYAESIEKAAPHYVEFWKEFVGEKDSDNMDTRREQAGSQDPNVNRNFLFLQQFSYKAIWELVTAWRERERLAQSLPFAAVDPCRYIDCAESFQGASAAAGACEDVLIKCLFLSLDMKNDVDWTKKRDTARLRQCVLAQLGNSNPDLGKRVGEFHSQHIEPTRNVLLHTTRFPGKFDEGAKTWRVLAPHLYDENQTWGANLKEHWTECSDPLVVLEPMLRDLGDIVNDVFLQIIPHLRLAVVRPASPESPVVPPAHSAPRRRILSPMDSGGAAAIGKDTNE